MDAEGHHRKLFFWIRPRLTDVLSREDKCYIPITLHTCAHQIFGVTTNRFPGCLCKVIFSLLDHPHHPKLLSVVERSITSQKSVENNTKRPVINLNAVTFYILIHLSSKLKERRRHLNSRGVHTVSGARYPGVPKSSFSFSPGFSCLAKPKSLITTRRSSMQRMFSS